MAEKNVFLIHGTCGHPNENWFPWLKRKLEEHGMKVYAPDFPAPDSIPESPSENDQRLEEWLERMRNYMDKVNDNTVMIGHSLGNAFILNLLERGHTIDSAFMVSSFVGLLDNDVFDTLNSSFTDRDFDFDTIRSNCGRFYLYHSRDDPYVPLEKAKYLKDKLEGELEVFDGCGHFNEDSGHDKFPELLKDLENRT